MPVTTECGRAKGADGRLDMGGCKKPKHNYNNSSSTSNCNNTKKLKNSSVRTLRENVAVKSEIYLFVYLLHW